MGFLALVSRSREFLLRLFHIFRPLFHSFASPSLSPSIHRRISPLVAKASSLFIPDQRSPALRLFLSRLSSLHSSLFILALYFRLSHPGLFLLSLFRSLAPHLRLIIHTSQPAATTTAHQRHRQYGIPLY